MNICFVIQNIACGGGTERVGTKIANELCRLGYGVTIASREAKNPPYFPLDPRIEVGVMLRTFLERRLRNVQWYAAWKLRRFLKRHEVDIVIDIDTKHAVWTYPAIRGTGIRWIAWDHFNYNYSSAGSLRRKALKYVELYAERLILLSKADVKAYIEKSKICPSKILQIYNPLSFEESAYGRRMAKKVLAIGRIDPQKGFDLLLHSWVKVEKTVSDWSLEIVCGYGDHNALQMEAERMGLRRVECTPPTIDVRGKLLDAGIFAFSSRFEGFGLVLTEAATMSVPAVSYDCPVGPDEIITDGVDGILVPPENTELFADALIRLMTDDVLRYAMGKAAHESSWRFSMRRIIPQWVEMLDTVNRRDNE